jgi:hypothetical protein
MEEEGPGAGQGPWSWTVTWGVLARPGFAVEHVTAFDADEALVLAAQLHPERPRPRVAFLSSRASERTSKDAIGTD